MDLGKLIERSAKEQGVKEKDLRSKLVLSLSGNLVKGSYYNKMASIGHRSINSVTVHELNIISDVLKIPAIELLNFK